MRLLAITSCLLATLTTAPPAQNATAEPERRPFSRYVSEPDGGQLETAIATYRRGTVTVTLLASVHVADREHYEDLQRRFAAFDKLLYEFIADPDLRPHPGMEFEEDWLSVVMSSMGRGFSLHQQEEVLDYRQDNFVHADMTNEEFEAAMARHNSSILGELMSTPNAEVDRDAEKRRGTVDLVEAFRSGRGAHAMRVMGARMMATPEPKTRKPTVIIEGRNDKCLAVLQEQLDAGVENIGIYYGAAHMEHMERRLLDDFGFEFVREEWITAWDCDRKRFPTVEKGLKQKRWRARRDVQKLRAAVVKCCEQNPGTTPTWAAVRQAQGNGKLPGRKDGVDPWGRPYALRMIDGEPDVRSLGSDGQIDTRDDVTAGAAAAFGRRAQFERDLERAKQEWQQGMAELELGGEESGTPKTDAELRRANADVVQALTDLERAARGSAQHPEKSTAKLARTEADLEYERVANALASARDFERTATEQARIAAEYDNAELKEQAAAFRRMAASTRRTAAQNAAAILARGVAAHATRHGRLPKSLTELTTGAERFLTKLPTDAWGNPFRLTGKTGSKFTVVSAGPDGKFGTADDVPHRDVQDR